MFAASSSQRPHRRTALAAIVITVTAFLAAAGVSPVSASHALAQHAPHAVVIAAEQCREIMATTRHVVRRLGPEKLSHEFRKGIVEFIMQDGQMNCAGPRQIPWRTLQDRTTFGNIAAQLRTAAANPVHLRRAGVSLTPAPAVSLSER